MNLVPNLDAIASVDPKKPALDVKNPMWIVAAAGAILAVIFAFLPWFTFSAEMFGVEVSASRLGITTWYGVIYLIFALVTAACVLYKQNALAIWTSVICVILAIIGLCSVEGLTIAGQKCSADEIKTSVEALKMIGMDSGVGHIGAILALIASLASGAGSFLLAMNDK